MAVTVALSGAEHDRAEWSAALESAAAARGLAMRLINDPAAIVAAAEDIDYLVYSPAGVLEDLRIFPKLKAILSMFAGVERLLARPDLPDLPVARMVEPGLTIGMTDYVVGHAMRAHLGIEAAIDDSRAGKWAAIPAKLSVNRPVGVMGLGQLGQDAARALATLRFPTRGWSRSPKTVEGVRSYAGAAELPAFLEGLEILIVLLPQTADTVGMVDAAALALLADGAHVINAARGPIVTEAALLAALDDREGRGPLGGATLDVFDIEPLPEDHPYWRHPKVIVTPHIASWTRAETASKVLIEQIERAEHGQPLSHLVDRGRGY